MEKTTQTHETDLPLLPWEYNCYAIILFLVGFFGFNFNLIALILISSDFCVSFLGTPWSFFAAVYRGWVFGRTMCVGYGFLMAVSGISSVTTLTTLAVERFCLVAFPLSKHLTRNVAFLIVVFIWVYSFILTIPPILGWGEYVNEAANISCSVNWESHEKNSTSYIIFLTMFGFFLPLAVIIYCYGSIMSKVKEINRSFSRKKSRSEKRATLMIGLMITTFLLAWTPYAIFAMIEQFSSMEISPKMEVIPAVLAKTSIVYNPIIYVTLNKQLLAALFSKSTTKQHYRYREPTAETVT